MAERTMKVLICDEPIMGQGNGPCEKPAIETITMIVAGDTRFEKDLCQRHFDKYFTGARRRNKMKGKR